MKLILTGFMGSGKSTIGRLLATKLGLEFVELDELLLSFTPREFIDEVFAQDGEEVFRELERKAAEQVRDKDGVVVSTGGGTVCYPHNAENLRANGGVIFYLHLSFELAKERVTASGMRPLFQDTEKARALYEQRLPLYRQEAVHEIELAGLSPEEVVEGIVGLL